MAVMAGTGNWGWVFAWSVTAGMGVNGLSNDNYCDITSESWRTTPFWISDVSLISPRTYVAHDLSLCLSEMHLVKN